MVSLLCNVLDLTITVTVISKAAPHIEVELGFELEWDGLLTHTRFILAERYAPKLRTMSRQHSHFTVIQSGLELETHLMVSSNHKEHRRSSFPAGSALTPGFGGRRLQESDVRWISHRYSRW